MGLLVLVSFMPLRIRDVYKWLFLSKY